MMSLAVEPESREDEEKITTGLRRLAEGDPTFTIRRDEQSREMVITGMSNLHLEVMLSRLQDRYGVSVQTHEPSVPYRETITREGKGQYRHKKQTGGRGQYGEVYLRVEPNDRGEGFEFIDEIKGGVIPNQFIPAVEKGIVGIMEEGILAGFPIVDVKAAYTFGLDDYLYGDGVCAIEWAERVEDLWPEEYLLIRLRHLDEAKRGLTFRGVGERYRELLSLFRRAAFGI
jgi:elongation factor G